MEVLEKLYSMAVKYRTCFDYHRQPNGNISVFLSEGETLLDYTSVDGWEYITLNGKKYDTISEALEDFESLILLKR